jgi:hypothetical protein
MDQRREMRTMLWTALNPDIYALHSESILYTSNAVTIGLQIG